MESLIGTVPYSWRPILLGEICDVLAGPSTARLKGKTHPGSDVPVVTPRDLSLNRIIHESGAMVSLEKAQEMPRYRLKEGDIVCSRTGDLGRRGLATEGQEGWMLGTACLRLRVHADLFPAYLTYCLGHPNVQDWIIRNSTGSAVPSINTETFSSMPLVVPPESVQVAAAEILGALDEKIAIHYQIGRTSTALRDAMLPFLLANARD